MWRIRYARGGLAAFIAQPRHASPAVLYTLTTSSERAREWYTREAAAAWWMMYGDGEIVDKITDLETPHVVIEQIGR